MLRCELSVAFNINLTFNNRFRFYGKQNVPTIVPHEGTATSGIGGGGDVITKPTITVTTPSKGSSKSTHSSKEVILSLN